MLAAKGAQSAMGAKAVLELPRGGAGTFADYKPMPKAIRGKPKASARQGAIQMPTLTVGWPASIIKG